MDTWMPGAVHKPVPLTGSSRRTNGPMPNCYGVVLHVNAAYSDDLYTWIMQGGKMSCHFQVNLRGVIYQYIPIDWTSWCQSAGNDNWISVETSGQATEMLNAAQLDAVKRIWAFCQAQRGLANQLAENPNGRGFGWHGMGAAPYWNGPQWGHAVCPGVRRPQRQDAIDFVKGDDTMSSTEYDALNKKFTEMFADVKSDIANIAKDVSAAATAAGEARRVTDILTGKRPGVGAPAVIPKFQFDLKVTETLATDEVLWSTDGRFSLSPQSDGNLVQRDVVGRAIWTSGTAGKGTGASLTLQKDGNLVLRNEGGTPIWVSGTVGSGSTSFVVQTDGNLVLRGGPKNVSVK